MYASPVASRLRAGFDRLEETVGERTLRGEERFLHGVDRRFRDEDVSLDGVVRPGPADLRKLRRFYEIVVSHLPPSVSRLPDPGLC